MKSCIKCNIEKPLTDFYNKVKKCKPCYIEDKKGKYLEKRKQYYLKNKQKIVSQIMDWNKNQSQLNPQFKLTGNIRTLIRESFKRGINGIYKKGKKTEYILGCTLEEFIQHLQNQFTEGMTLENHGQGPGKWNIDHITPISSAQTEEEIYKLNHYTNLQPLWWEENMAKGAKGRL
jgi:hypothetical protein